MSMLRSSKQLFFDKLSNSDQKTFWKTVWLLNNKQSSIHSLQSNGNTIVSASGKAELLDNFFFGCFKHNVPPLVHSDIHCENIDPAACPKDILCNEDSVLDQLTSLDVTKVTGCDGISARMLKSTAVSIAPSLTELLCLYLPVFILLIGRLQESFQCQKEQSSLLSLDTDLYPSYLWLAN